MLKVPFCTHGTARLSVGVHEMNLVFEAGVRQHSILLGKEKTECIWESLAHTAR
jgi:hypothetical protein